MKRVIAFISLMSFLAVPALLRAQSEVGAWKLNTAKSKYTGVAMRRSLMVTMEAKADWITCHTEGVAGDGSPIDFRFMARYDGRDHPIDGKGVINGADSVAWKRIDARTTEVVYKKIGKPVATGRATISKDGKIRTLELKGTGLDGKPTSTRAVYEKQ
jgi:hypothetical protein